MLDAKELEDYLKRAKEDPINSITMALVNEYIDNYVEALRIWSSLRTTTSDASSSLEGCERTVSILKRKKDLDMVKKYGKWVLETNPKVGLTLFTNDAKTGE